MERGDRHQEGVDRDVGEALYLGFQLEAVRTIRVAENRQRACAIAAHVLHRIGQRQAGEVDARLRILAFRREVALGFHVEEMTEQEVLAALIDVGEVRTHDDLEHAGPGCRIDRAEARGGVEALQPLGNRAWPSVRRSAPRQAAEGRGSRRVGKGTAHCEAY
jgi:hypothetical protein